MKGPSIAAVRGTRKIVAAIAVATAATVAIGCGDSGTEPSIPLENAEELAATIDEIRANVDNGSCLVAQDRADELIGEIDGLPSEVDQDVQNALDRGALNLKDLIDEQCE